MFEAALEADPAHPVALTRYADLCYSLYPPHPPPTRTPVDSRAAVGADGQSASSRLAPPPHTHTCPPHPMPACTCGGRTGAGSGA